MNLLRAVTTVSGMTLLSRITGLARESLKATVFGAGVQMDAFEAAFRLPNILRRMFAEGAFSQAFVPVLSEYHRQRGAEATRDLVGRVGSLLALVLARRHHPRRPRGALARVCARERFAQTPGKVELTAQMIRIVFPYILFVSLVSLAGGVLNVYRRFAIPAFTPVLLNLSIIGAAIFLSRYFDPPILALAWGVFIGGVAQLALQIVPLAKLGMLPRFQLDFRDEGVRRVLLLDGSRGDRRVGGADLGAHQYAARGVAGRRAHLVDHYADRLMEFPSALLGVARRHRAAAVAREASQRRQSRRVLGAARLGLASFVPARLAGSVRPLVACSPAHHDALPIRPVRRQRRVADALGAARLQRRAARRSSS